MAANRRQNGVFERPFANHGHLVAAGFALSGDPFNFTSTHFPRQTMTLAGLPRTLTETNRHCIEQLRRDTLRTHQCRRRRPGDEFEDRIWNGGCAGRCWETDFKEIWLFLARMACSGHDRLIEKVLKHLAECNESGDNNNGGYAADTVIDVEGDGGGLDRGHFGAHVASSKTFAFTSAGDTGAARNPEPGHSPGYPPAAKRRWQEHTARHQESPPGSEDLPATARVCRAPKIEDLVNFKWTQSSQPGGQEVTLLHCAILCGSEGAVECLLKWGADITQGLFTHRFPSVCWEYGPLFLATSLQHCSIVQCLIAHGASPYNSQLDLRKHHLSTFESCRDDPDVSEALCQNAEHPPPVADVCEAYANGHIETATRLKKYVRWDTDCAVNPRMLSMLIACLDGGILDVPCRTEMEVICKRFFCSLSLARLCENNTTNCLGLSDPLLSCSHVVRGLLQAGVDSAGLSEAKASALCEAWLVARCAEETVRAHTEKIDFLRPARSDLLDWAMWPNYRQVVLPPYDTPLEAACVRELPSPFVPALPPHTWPLQAKDALRYFSQVSRPALRRLQLCRSLDDEVLQLLVREDGIPGIGSAEDLPFAGGQLHDGPMCQCDVELSPVQRMVSFSDVVSPALQPKRLSQLCRGAIIAACRTQPFTESARQLGLPPLLRDYILFK